MAMVFFCFPLLWALLCVFLVFIFFPFGVDIIVFLLKSLNNMSRIQFYLDVVTQPP